MQSVVLAATCLLLSAACGSAPATHEPLEETQGAVVIGSDDRTIVRANTTLPFAAHVAFRVKNAVGQTSRCTGTLIGKNTILTAAHCFYKQDRAPHAVHHIWQMIPGADYLDDWEDQDPYPYGEWYLSTSCAVEHYPSHFDVNELRTDYAVVDLSACPKTTTYQVPFSGETHSASRSSFKTVPVLANLSISSTGTSARLAGYPATVPPGSWLGAQWPTLFMHASGSAGHKVYRDASVPERVRYVMDATSGQSGAPVLYNMGGTSGWGVFAIHSRDDGWGDENYGRYIDAEVWAFIQAHSADL